MPHLQSLNTIAQGIRSSHAHIGACRFRFILGHAGSGSYWACRFIACPYWGMQVHRMPNMPLKSPPVAIKGQPALYAILEPPRGYSGPSCSVATPPSEPPLMTAVAWSEPSGSRSITSRHTATRGAGEVDQARDAGETRCRPHQRGSRIDTHAKSLDGCE